jgi:hypothetical protein
MLGLFSDECTIRNSPDNPSQWIFRLASERFRPDLVDTESHGRPSISIMVWAMVWQQGGEGGASKLVFCKGHPDSPRGGVTFRSYCDVLDEGLRRLYEPGTYLSKITLQLTLRAVHRSGSKSTESGRLTGHLTARI